MIRDSGLLFGPSRTFVEIYVVFLNLRNVTVLSKQVSTWSQFSAFRE